MDFTKIQTDVTAWITENKYMAIAIGLALAGGVYLLAKSSADEPTQPKRPSLSGISSRRKRRKSRKVELMGLK